MGAEPSRVASRTWWVETDWAGDRVAAKSATAAAVRDRRGLIDMAFSPSCDVAGTFAVAVAPREKESEQNKRRQANGPYFYVNER